MDEWISGLPKQSPSAPARDRRWHLRMLAALLCAGATGVAGLFAPAAALAQSIDGSSTTASTVNGLIIRLRPSTDASTARETPEQARARLALVFQGAPIAMGTSRRLTRDMHVVRWSRPLEAAEAERLMRALRAHPDVLTVSPDQPEKAQQVAPPSDPYYASSQWWLSASPSTTGSAGVPGVASAWDIVGGGGAATIAVVDTGLVRSHPDLSGERFQSGYDFVPYARANDGDEWDADFDDPGDGHTATECTAGAADSTWHGTFIAGQVGALTDNSIGVAGINREANVVTVRVAGKCGADQSDVITGMLWAGGLPVDGAPANSNPSRIINVSFGSGNVDCATYQPVIDELRAAGVLVIAAAGNSGTIVNRPARCSGVLAVGAVTRDGAKTSYSNAGAEVGITTIGGEISGALADGGIVSTSNSGTTSQGVNTYLAEAGTSFSTPMVSGVASLMLAINPDLTVDELEYGLTSTARAHQTRAGLATCQPNQRQGNCNCTTTTCGAGLLDASAALAYAANPTPVPTDPDPGTGGGGSSGSSGGGGAMQGGWLVGLALAIGMLAPGRRRA